MISGDLPEYLEPDLGDDFSFCRVRQLVGDDIESLDILEICVWLNSRGSTTLDELLNRCARYRKTTDVAFLKHYDPTQGRR